MLTATILLLAFGVGAASASPGTRRADLALDVALQKVVDQELGPPGVIAVVQRGGHRRLHTAGIAEVGGSAITGRQHMRVASTSKAFSGAAALTLVERGKLRLNDTIAELLPDLPAEWGEVTLRQLLDHTSGVPSFTTQAAYLDDLVNDLTGGPADQGKLLDYVPHYLAFHPGTRYAYSNSDNIVIALMVEQASGRSYRRGLHRLVASPLGLGRTTLPHTATMPAPFAHGYDIAPPAAPEDVSEVLSPNWTGASGGIVSSPIDLNSFARGYIGGELFSPRVQKQQLKLVKGSSEPPGPGQNRAGLGVFRYRTNCGTVYGHTGNIPGYTQFFAATLNGRRSVTVSATEQLNPEMKEHVFNVLRRAEGLAVCAALAR